MQVTADIYIDGVKLPPADKRGVKITPQTLWSQNAGRMSSTGLFVGDIKNIKYDVTYTRSYCTYDELELINSLVNTMRSIHSVRMYLPGYGKEVTKNYYIGSGTVSYTVKEYKNGKPVFENISFEMIEQ